MSKTLQFRLTKPGRGSMMGTEEWSKKLQMLKRGVGMRASLSARKEQIAEYVRQYYLQHDRLPS